MTETHACAACGAAVSAWARFCTVCGTTQPDPEPVPVSTPEFQVPWRGWEAFGVALLAILAGAIATVPLVLLLSRPDMNGVVHGRNNVVAASICVSELATLGVVLLWIKARHHVGWKALGWRTDDVRGDVRAGVGAGVLGLAVQIPISFLVLAIARLVSGHKVVQPTQLAFEGRPGIVALIFTGIGAVILAPIAEEALFRGMLFRSYRKWAGPTKAAILSGIVFGLAHVQPLYYLPIGALGFILARTFERRNSILANMVGHATFNLIGFIVIIAGLR